MLKGQLTPDGFHVEPNGVMAKCPSKYEAAKLAPGQVRTLAMASLGTFLLLADASSSAPTPRPHRWPARGGARGG